MVQYEWYGSPAKDFTLKIYSKHAGTQIFDQEGLSNMLYTDGREPSEFALTRIDVVDAISTFDDYFYYNLDPAAKHLTKEDENYLDQCINASECSNIDYED